MALFGVVGTQIFFDGSKVDKCVAVNYNKIQLQVLMCMISLGLQMAVT